MMPFPFPFTMFHVAPARLLITAPLCTSSVAPAVELPKVVIPETFSVRVSRTACGEVKLIPPFALVAPAPVIVPPVQFKSPVTTKLPTPVNVPPLRYRDARVTVAPVANVTVPEMMLFVTVLRLELALKFTAVAEKLAVPPPLTEDPALKLKVPLEKFSVAPKAALKVPASVPLRGSFGVPPSAFPAPLLLTAAPRGWAIPPVISNVRDLWTVGPPP